MFSMLHDVAAPVQDSPSRETKQPFCSRHDAASISWHITDHPRHDARGSADASSLDEELGGAGIFADDDGRGTGSSDGSPSSVGSLRSRSRPSSSPRTVVKHPVSDAIASKGKVFFIEGDRAAAPLAKQMR